MNAYRSVHHDYVYSVCCRRLEYKYKIYNLLNGLVGETESNHTAALLSNFSSWYWFNIDNPYESTFYGLTPARTAVPLRFYIKLDQHLWHNYLKEFFDTYRRLECWIGDKITFLSLKGLVCIRIHSMHIKVSNRSLCSYASIVHENIFYTIIYSTYYYFILFK